MSQLPNTITDLLANTKEKVDIEKKIMEMLIDDTNLDTKTDLSQPIKWAILLSLANYLKEKGLVYSAQIIFDFIKTSHKYLISKDRKGRSELVQALQIIREKQQLDQPNGNIPQQISMKVK